MSTTTAQERLVEERQEDSAKRRQIMDGARRTFLANGFDAASMNEIARTAGVSKGTIYVYFDNKEELFEAMIEEERCAIFSDLYWALEQGGEVRGTLIRFGVALATKITSEKVTRAQGIISRLGTRIANVEAIAWQDDRERPVAAARLNFLLTDS